MRCFRCCRVHGRAGCSNLVPSLRRIILFANCILKNTSSVHILGTNPESIERAEDRTKHSQLLDSIGVLQLRWVDSSSEAEVKLFADRVGFPVLAPLGACWRQSAFIYTQ